MWPEGIKPPCSLSVGTAYCAATTQVGLEPTPLKVVHLPSKPYPKQENMHLLRVG